MQRPPELFAELVSALETGQDNNGAVTLTLSPATVSWLHDGCTQFATGERSALCTALGLRGQGLNLPVSQYARQTRDAALRAAFSHIAGQSKYERCQALGYTIRQFENRTWPRVCNLSEPPARLTDTQRHIFAAFRAYGRVPRSTSRLSEILR